MLKKKECFVYSRDVSSPWSTRVQAPPNTAVPVQRTMGKAASGIQGVSERSVQNAPKTKI